MDELLTLHEHRVLGLELARITQELLWVGGELVERYPPGHEVRKVAAHLTNGIDELRRVLDSEVEALHPGPDWERIHYPRGYDRGPFDRPADLRDRRP